MRSSRGEKRNKVRTVAKGDERPEGIKDDARVNHAVVVQLAEVLDRRDALLVVLKAVDLCSAKVSSENQTPWGD